MGGKTYWVGNNLKYENRVPLETEPVILDLLGDQDDRVCLQYDKMFCFTKDKEGMDPENKMKQVMQEVKRQEAEIRKKRLEQEKLKSLSEQYDQLEKQYAKWGLPASDQNLFVDLMQEIATELKLSNCWVCGGLKSAEKWPWRGEGLTPEQLLKWETGETPKIIQRPEGWVLDQRVIGTFCLSREGGLYSEIVGYTPCISTLSMNSTSHIKVWQPESPPGYWSREKKNNCEWSDRIGLCWYKSPGANPYQSISQLSKYWDKPESITTRWKAPNGLHWICGKKAYSELPPRWKGSCTVGLIRPVFFTLPRSESSSLGAPLYESLNREKRSLKERFPLIGGEQTWGEDEWPAERIIEYYGPATWAQDGSWGYRTPIYLLNRLIRLQAVVEIVSNHTSDALELLSQQHSQMRAFVYQNRIALDYLLAGEGGVCGKFNESQCCVEINDYGETIRDLATEIKRVAHVPVQKWNSLLQASWWDHLFDGAWWKKVIFFILCSVAGVIFLPCLIPCFIRLIHSVVQGMQIAALPTDPEAALGKTNQVPKIMTLGEEIPHSRAAEALAKFERRIKNKEQNYTVYQEIPNVINESE
uniref:Envelope glycoprotein n=1 Tax=Taeniopygia guttata TaxID=59729 RepID=A0A674H2S3_TAEGU